MRGEVKTTVVLDLSELNCIEETLGEISTPSRNTTGFKGGTISRKNDATNDIMVPPDATPIEGETERIEAGGRAGNTVMEKIASCHCT